MDLPNIYNNSSAILISSENSWIEGHYLSVFSGKPDFSIYFRDKQLFFTNNDNVTEPSGVNPFDLIEEKIANGYYAVGYIGYDYLAYTDIGVKISRQKYRSDLPLIYFNFYSPGKVKQFNPKEAEHILYVTRRDSPGIRSDGLEYLTGKKEYISKIKAIKQYIEAGDVYQVNLSHKIISEYKRGHVDSFFKYFSSQPVPYGIYIDCDKFHFLGGSMEQFIEKKGDIITTKPIKGTSKRSRDVALDNKIKEQLSNNPKERAENLMIVDLMRNDLSRICKTGTVKVNKLFNIKSYKTLHQMESEIAGQLQEDIRLKDIIYSVFPPGSVTGAPKKRAVEIIDELEDHNRGPYCGCAGVFTPGGDFTLCVSIRTAILKYNIINYWAGSGIVYDSDPEKEYRETLLKSNAFLSFIS